MPVLISGLDFRTIQKVYAVIFFDFSAIFGQSKVKILPKIGKIVKF